MAAKVIGTICAFCTYNHKIAWRPYFSGGFYYTCPKTGYTKVLYRKYQKGNRVGLLKIVDEVIISPKTLPACQICRSCSLEYTAYIYGKAVHCCGVCLEQWA